MANQNNTNLSEPQRWQPIDTAPFNQAVLVYLPHWDHYGYAVYRAIQVDMGNGAHWVSTAWASGRNLGIGAEPTHWMPLPEPPLVGQTEAANVG